MFTVLLGLAVFFGGFGAGVGVALSSPDRRSVFHRFVMEAAHWLMVLGFAVVLVGLFSRR